jgi:hypothetical protein
VLLLAHYDREQLILILSQGTFWYHSHFKTQYCDGLRGPLVVYDACDPHRDLYDVDDGKRDGGEELFTRLRFSRRVHCYHPCGLVSLRFDGRSRDSVSQTLVIAALLLTYIKLQCVQFHFD